MMSNREWLMLLTGLAQAVCSAQLRAGKACHAPASGEAVLNLRGRH